MSASQHRADNMDRPVLLVDPGGRLRHANAPACALFGEHLEPGRPLADLLTGLDLTRAPISPVQVELRAPAPRQPAQAYGPCTSLGLPDQGASPRQREVSYDAAEPQR